MQLPNANNDLFMKAPSCSRMPQLLVFEALSDPAKSINESLPDFLVKSESSILSHYTWNIAWDLLDVSFAPVASYILFLFPYIKI
jgi:hypothetical protein